MFSFFVFFFFFLFFFLFFFFFFALLLLLLLLVLRHLTHNPPPPPKEIGKKGDHLEERKNPALAGENATPDTVFLSEPAGESERKEKPKNATSFCGCVIEPTFRAFFRGLIRTLVLHFALRSRRFRDIAIKKRVQISTWQHIYIYSCIYIYVPESY